MHVNPAGQDAWVPGELAGKAGILSWGEETCLTSHPKALACGDPSLNLEWFNLLCRLGERGPEKGTGWP